MEPDIQTGNLIEQLAQAVLYGSIDKEDGTSAFLEKHQTSFIGQIGGFSFCFLFRN